ncbi:MAG: KamA family radical SAM protein [Spirochaetaceae bacterium]|jgi:lysine 2,3-aminomutase|nr:KamA family radical SAM protein [Spirochaetaceae bacterium]
MITDIDGLPPILKSSITAEEAAYLETLRRRKGFPFGVTAYFASLAGANQDDPIRRQFFPDPREALADPFALDDPLGEAVYRAAPRLTHQYRDRALILAGGACPGYCRHCFRRLWMARAQNFIDAETLTPILGYLKEHSEIREVLVSGGDPLTASDEALAWLFGELRAARPGLLLRLCTRAPITDPYRLTPRFIELLQAYRPVRMAVHINHPRELAEPARKALGECAQAGIPVHVQTVLLRGVNDNAEILGDLFRECLDLGLSPYYLFQLDLAFGTAHFRVPLEEGLNLYRDLGRRVSGLALPRYAVDLPGGGGKLILHGGVIAGAHDSPRGAVYMLKAPDGRLWAYPQ